MDILGGSGLIIKELQRSSKTKDAASGGTAETLTGEAGSTAGNSSAVSAGQSNAASGNSGVSSSGERNMLSGNFFDANYEQSQYLTARLDSFNVANQIKQSSENELFSMMDQFGGVTVGVVYSPGDKTAGAGASENEIKSALTRKSDREVMEKAQEEFEKEREAQEAEDAAAASEAQGGSELAVTDGGAQASAVPDSTDASSTATEAGQSTEAGVTIEQIASAAAASAIKTQPAVAPQDAAAQDFTTAAQSAPYVPVDVIV